MADVTIKLRDDGPYIITGKVQLLDAEGNAFEVKETMALCRCGRSENKPFCDGSHKQGFKDQARA